MGLIRKALVLGGLFLALPSPPPTAQVAGGQPSLQSSTFATFSAAADTVSDFKGFCERRAQACVTGQYLAATIEGKAKYTARLLYEWANPGSTGRQDQIATAAVTAAPQSAPGKAAKAPSLRLATLTDAKPSRIEDLLRTTEN